MKKQASKETDGQGNHGPGSRSRTRQPQFPIQIPGWEFRSVMLLQSLPSSIVTVGAALGFALWLIYRFARRAYRAESLAKFFRAQKLFTQRS
jgi:hypothetical protein